MLHACLNGTRPRGAHSGLPLTPSALARDARAVADLGVRSVHVHPRRAREAVAAAHVGDVVAAIRAEAPDTAVGVPIARWAEPDPARRIEALAAWAELGSAKPDVVAVAVRERGWLEVCAAAHAGGIRVELGVSTTSDAVMVRRAGLPPGVVRLVAGVPIVEPVPAVAEAARILRTLGPVPVPVLLHGEDAGAWSLLEYAVRMQLDGRIGLADVLVDPTGRPTSGNAALVTEAQRLRRRVGLGVGVGVGFAVCESGISSHRVADFAPPRTGNFP